MRYKLLDFTVRIQQRMELEKCNVFNRLFCSTFETYINFNVLTSYWTSYCLPGKLLKSCFSFYHFGLNILEKTDILNTVSI